MWDNLLFALGVTAPIFIVFCAGIVLKRLGMITNEFARMGSELVFRVALPCMLFVKLVQISFETLPVFLLIYAALATVLVYGVLDYVIAPRLAQADRGAFVQGSFRANMGIVGLAYCLNIYGDAILATASVYLAIMTIIFNILSVMTLSRHHQATQGGVVIATVGKIFRNPLIIAIVLAIVLSILQWQPPKFVLDTLGYFSLMTLPLALICAGAAIRWREFHTSLNVYWATLAKLVLVPGIIVLGAIIVGIRGEALAVLYLMSAAPTATASYPMAQAMGANHYLSSAVIATTSLGSVLAITLGLWLLRELSFI